MSEHSVFWLLTLVTIWVVLETFDAGVAAAPGGPLVSPDALVAVAWPALSAGWLAAVLRFRPRLHPGQIILGVASAVGLAVGAVLMLWT